MKKNFKILAALSIIPVSLLMGCTNSQTSESTGQYIDGSVITAKVKSKLLADKFVSGLPITVKTYKNTVQLSGFVNNVEQKRRAELLTSQVKGVDRIEDSLIIKSR
jgi:hyperosmotically inducible protein